MIKKILIANRGEIACRIIKTAKKLKIKSVSIYSDSDINAEHVLISDESYYLGPSEASKSYLNISKIIEICKKAKVDAVHPGYGFLSENEQFAQLIIDAGFLFIGPSPESIKIMGSKLEAKQLAEKYKIPMIPGTNEAINKIDLAYQKAKSEKCGTWSKSSSISSGDGHQFDLGAWIDSQIRQQS